MRSIPIISWKWPISSIYSFFTNGAVKVLPSFWDALYIYLYIYILGACDNSVGIFWGSTWSLYEHYPPNGGLVLISHSLGSYKLHDINSVMFSLISFIMNIFKELICLTLYFLFVSIFYVLGYFDVSESKKGNCYLLQKVLLEWYSIHTKFKSPLLLNFSIIIMIQ